VLAFSGCYVAAEFASFRPIDRIFTRMGNGDAADANASTFLVECRELSLLLNHATKSSLVIIDELVWVLQLRVPCTCRFAAVLIAATPRLASSAAQGRATSTSDGFAIAFAASELLLSTGAMTLSATHMERMADLGSLYAGSKHCHLRIVALNDRIQFVHELTEARA
jgi:DNA mismatch repair protein MSH4